MRFSKLALVYLACLALAPAAHAQIATFDLSYSGASHGNSAVGTGTITLDESLINNPGLTFNPPPFITALSLTISGASSGNGTFTLPDFANYFLRIGPGTVDFSQDLVGQPNFIDFNVFNVFGNSAPYGSQVQTITTDQGFGDPLTLTSFRPAATPEPGSLALLATSVLTGAGFLACRRRHARLAA